MSVIGRESGLPVRGGRWKTLRLAAGLSRSGHTVTVLSPKGSPCLEMARQLGLAAEPLTAASVRGLSHHADLTHAHDARSHTTAAPLIVSRRVSFTIRGGLSRWKYASPRHFIAVSNYVKDVLIEAGVGPERISVIYDGVPLLNAST